MVLIHFNNIQQFQKKFKIDKFKMDKFKMERLQTPEKYAG